MISLRKYLKVRTLMIFVLVTFILSIVYITVRIIQAPVVAPVSDPLARVKGDYVLMLLQSIVGVFAMSLPTVLKRRTNLEIPSGMIAFYALFLFCAIYLGEVRAFYYNVPHWDTILHTFSGAALGALGFSVISLLNKSETITFDLSPFFVAIFALCFAVTIGVVWEFYEFGMDFFFGTNMQKHSLETGEPLLGQAALLDTMKDLMVDTLGASVMCLIGYISLKYQKGWIERFQVKSKK